MNSLQDHKLFSTNDSHCWLVLSRMHIIILGSLSQLQTCRSGMLTSPAYIRRPWPAGQSHTGAESKASSLQRRGMWQTTYEFHHTYYRAECLHANTFIEHLFCAWHLSGCWGNNSEQRKSHSGSLHSIEGENNKPILNKHLILIYQMVISTVKSGSGWLMNV